MSKFFLKKAWLNSIRFLNFREDQERDLETQVMRAETELVNVKLKMSSAQQNKHNVGESDARIWIC